MTMPACVSHAAVPWPVVSALGRRLWVEVRDRGISAEEVAAWSGTTAFPWLRDSPEVVAPLRYLDRVVGRSAEEEWCEPQILFKFPSTATTLPPPHQDIEPPWAAGRRYRLIAGVTVANGAVEDGAPIVYDRDGQHPQSVPTAPGDLIVMTPDTLHSSGLNTGAGVRIIVWYRLLERWPEPAGSAG